jgi:lipoprotein-anchoring transpeptidase ErfK/SrfK
LSFDKDQSLFARSVKGLARRALQPSGTQPDLQTGAFRQRRASKSGFHVAVGCEIRQIMAFLAMQSNFAGDSLMRRGVGFLIAAAALMAMVGNASADETDTRTFMDFNFKMSGGASTIPRTTVNFAGNYAPGTIIVNTAERRLYLVQPNGQALRYGIGVGRDGFRWGGTHRITAKKEWPSWTPPAQMLARRPDLPRHMKGGIDNPLGARAMYLGSTLYRIHGSNEPETIGQAVSSGCFRMTNEDLTDLYNRVSVGTTVVVKN